MRFVLNVIWLIFGGLEMCLAYLAIGLICFITVVGIPFGIACWRIANYTLWPFGRTVVQRPTAGVGSVLGNIVWIILAGLWLAIGHIVAAVLCFITIIGIPLGLAHLKLVPIAFAPLGCEIVPADAARGW